MRYRNRPQSVAHNMAATSGVASLRSSAVNVDQKQWRHADPRLARLWPLLGRCIAFHERLVDVTGSVKASLMLSQAIYWTRHGRDVRDRDGWFFKTMPQWQHETGLSRHEQVQARAILRRVGLMQEQKSGLPAKPFFRVDGQRLSALLCEHMECQTGAVNWDDGEQVSRLLGPVQSFHRSLLSVSGKVNAALFLSRALYLTRTLSSQRAEGWFCRSASQWSNETGLTWRQQAGARSVLRRLGLADEKLEGMPPHVFLRVNVERLIALLSLPLNEVRERPLRKGIEQACGNTSPKFCANRQTRMWESHIETLRQAANKVAAKRNNSEPLSASSYVQHLITRDMSTKPPLITVPEQANDEASHAARGGDTLIFPVALLPGEKSVAEVLVTSCSQHAQSMLDELAGRMDKKTIRVSPIAYLRGLVDRARAGTFVPELAVRVAARRSECERLMAVRLIEDAERERFDCERRSPDYQEKLAKRRHELRESLNSKAAGRMTRPNTKE